MTLLIDADWLCYSSCCACEQDVRWDEWCHTLHLDERDVLDLIATKLELYQEISGDKGKIVMCFTEYPTFRHTIFPNYKSNRAGRRKPLGLKNIIEAIARYYDVAAFPGLEADDVMGLLSTGDRYTQPIIVSADKDMRTIPCTLLRGEEMEIISKKKADRNWMIQTLTGDKTDGFDGLAGVGPVTAEKILGDSESLPAMWDKVLTAYEKKKLSYTSAIQTARLTRILRDGEYNFTTGEVSLWEPA